MKNFALIMVSICVALGLFVFVHSQRNNVQRVIVMPVEIHNKPLNKVLILDKKSRQVQVTLQGPTFLVNDIVNSVRSVKLALPEKVDANYTAPIREDMLDLPPAIEVLNIDPKVVNVKIDDYIKKSVPVVVPRIGKIKSDYRIVSIVKVPEYVEIEGAVSEVAKIMNVHTEPINLTRIEQDMNIRLALIDDLKNAQMSPKEITLMLKVAPRESTRIFENVEVEVHSRSRDSISITPRHVWLKVSGPKAVVEAMTIDDVTAYVKLGKIDQSLGKVRFSLPEGVSAIGWKPTAVNVLVNKEE